MQTVQVMQVMSSETKETIWTSMDFNGLRWTSGPQVVLLVLTAVATPELVAAQVQLQVVAVWIEAPVAAWTPETLHSLKFIKCYTAVRLTPLLFDVFCAVSWKVAITSSAKFSPAVSSTCRYSAKASSAASAAWKMENAIARTSIDSKTFENLCKSWWRIG